MIDLHTHTNCSDGSDDYKTLLQKAEKKKITYLSITDHDNCKVYEQMEKESWKKYYTGNLIKGVELQAYVLGTSIELLGYGVDPNIINKETKKLYLPFETINQTEMERLYKKCIKIGMKFDQNVIENYQNSNEYYATKYLHNEMKKYTENKRLIEKEEDWKEESSFFRNYTSNPKSILYVDESDLIPDAKKVISVIKEAGGLVFIPHIYQYESNWKEILEYLIRNCEIDGIECYYPTFSKEQTEYIVNYAKENHKYISGGSDYHGCNRPDTELGTGIQNNLCIKEEIIKDWISTCIK